MRESVEVLPDRINFCYVNSIIRHLFKISAEYGDVVCCCTFCVDLARPYV